MSKFTPSPLQQAIFDFIQNDTRSLIIQAVAGSGKTTTITKSMRYLQSGKSVLFAAFNKSIAEELKERLPSFVNTMTLNGLGHRAWQRHVGGRIELNSSKTHDILRGEEFEDRTPDVFRARQMRAKIRRLVNLAKQVGMVPPEAKDVKGIVPNTDESWDAMIEHFDIEFLNEDDKLGMPPEKAKKEELSAKLFCIAMANIALEISISKWQEIDFDDQLYMTVIHGAKVPQFHYVFVDEAQDVSAIQRELLRRAVMPEEGRLIAVGDPHQAIYGFRGADSKSLDRIEEEFKCVRLPLSISYRCPQSVVREAQKYVGHIEAAPTAPEGIVANRGTYNPLDMKNHFRPGDMVVSRNTAPLIRCAFDLIKNRIPAKVQGADMKKSLTDLVENLRSRDLDDLEDRLEIWYQKEMKRILDRDPEASTLRVEEKYMCLRTFLTHSGANTVDELLYSISSLFDCDGGAVVTLSTIHKAKGLEADRVILLDKWLLPSKWARKPWQRDQEVNLSYVAVTRAKSELIFIDSPKG